jgi:hypothetical protein
LWTDFYDMHLIVDIESVFKVLGYKLRIVIVHHMNLFSWCFFFFFKKLGACCALPYRNVSSCIYFSFGHLILP